MFLVRHNICLVSKIGEIDEDRVEREWAAKNRPWYGGVLMLCPPTRWSYLVLNKLLG